MCFFLWREAQLDRWKDTSRKRREEINKAISSRSQIHDPESKNSGKDIKQWRRQIMSGPNLGKKYLFQR